MTENNYQAKEVGGDLERGNIIITLKGLQGMIIFPIGLYPKLKQATEDQLKKIEFHRGGAEVFWTEIPETIVIDDLVEASKSNRSIKFATMEEIMGTLGK